MSDTRTRRSPPSLRRLEKPKITDDSFHQIGVTRGRPIWHRFTADEIEAVDFALAIDRPLLVRGETGIGKSQLARAVAHVLERPFVPRVLDAQFSARDLLYEVDAVSRLAQAQLMRAEGTKPEDVETALDVMKFVEPGPLWWAYDWAGASSHARRSKLVDPFGHDGKNGVVVLLDEIDKAEPSVPNGLLDVLGNGGFELPRGRVPPAAVKPMPAPLVVIATNEERALPDAFVRRCVVLVLRWEDDKAPERLSTLAAKQFPELMQIEELVPDAIRLLLEGRRKTPEGLNRPGQAEFIDLLDALACEAPERARDKLTAISKFVFEKHRPVRGSAARDG